MRLTRRRLLAASLFLPCLPALAQGVRRIPQRPSARIIVDNDFAGDPDGLAALAHQLLAPRTRTMLVTASALDPHLMTPELSGRSARHGRELAEELIRLARIPIPPTVVAGAERLGDEGPSEAARAIVREAMRDDPLPLFLTCGGPLTNVAAALRLEPAIAGRITLVWIGGGPYPGGGSEYNLAADPGAARKIFEESRIPLWQVPQNAYREMQYSIAELSADFRPISALSRWLYDQYTNLPSFVDLGGALSLGDNPLVLLTAISRESSRSHQRLARRITADLHYGAEIPDRSITVYDELDARLTFADFLALMRLHNG